MIETKGALLSGKENSKQKVQGSLVSEESQPKKQQHTNSCLKAGGWHIWSLYRDLLVLLFPRLKSQPCLFWKHPFGNSMMRATCYEERAQGRREATPSLIPATGEQGIDIRR